jgi:hypothetical protein
MINIKEILKKEGQMLKLSGIAPDGFVLIHEDTLNNLKDFKTWRSWKHNEITIKELNNKNFK